MGKLIWGLLGTGAASLLCSCSLVYGGSEYTGSSAPLNANGMPTDAVARIFLLAGERDTPAGITECFEARVSDVLYSDVRADGVLDPWKHANPIPALGTFRATLIDDEIVAFGLGPDNGVKPSLLRAPLTADGVGDWSLSLGVPLAGRAGYAQLALGASAGYLVGGVVDLSEQGGSCQSPVPDTSYASIDPASGALGAERATAPIGLPRAFPGTLVVGSTLFVVGGTEVETGPVGAVESAAIAADGSLGAFERLADLPDGNGGTLGVERPSLCAGEGHFYVVGGNIHGEKSDVVVHAAVGGAGALGAWSVVQSLPGVHLNGGCFVVGGRLYVLGGEGSTARKDTVVMADIGADGSLTSVWDTTSNPPLPFARSGFAVVAVPNEG